MTYYGRRAEEVRGEVTFLLKTSVWRFLLRGFGWIW